MKFVMNPPVVIPELNTISENGKRLYVTPDGTKLPSITTVLGEQSKKGIMKWRNRVGEIEANKISKQSSTRGTKLHSVCENYLRNNDDELFKELPYIRDLFLHIRPIIDGSVSEVWYLEQSLYSLKLGLAGRVDFIGKWNGIPSIIDFKTSSKPKKMEWIQNYFQQETAYALMFKDLTGIPIKQLVTLIAVEGGKPQVFVEKTRDHVPGLVEAIKFYKNSIAK